MPPYCTTPAVLTLAIPSGPTLDLMDRNNGFRVGVVDLGYPNVREDVDLAADRAGTLDFTALFADRAVTISGSLVPSPAGSRQKAFHLLAPFLDPAARLTLTYQIDADTTPRTMTLRASALSAPMSNPFTTDFQVGWKAADPFAYDANVQTAVVWAKMPAGAGRQYNLVFNRVYPPGGGQSVSTATNGDFNVFPLLRLYGPATGPTITWLVYPASGASFQNVFSFQSSFIISAGTYVQIDCKARTAYLNGDPGQSVYYQIVPQVNTQYSPWPFMPPGGTVWWTLNATGTSGATQLQIQWQDAYLL